MLELRRKPALLPDADAYALNCYAYDLLTVKPEDLRQPSEALRVALLAYERSDDDYHFNRFTLAMAYEASENLDEAIEFARRALAHAPLEHSTERAEYETVLVRCLEKTGDVEGAEQVYRDTLVARRAHSPPSDQDVAASLFDLGNILLKHGKHAEAEPLLRECLETRQDLLAKPAEDTCTLTLGCDIARTMIALGECLVRMGRYADAEPLLLESLSTFESLPDETDNLALTALESIIQLYEEWGKEDQAVEWRTRLVHAGGQPTGLQRTNP
jgi:tetratricopeptide (TPR) repeat protein